MSITPALNEKEAHHKSLGQLRFPRFDHKQHGPVVNVNEAADQNLTVGQKVADTVAANMGSWRFIIIQSLILLVWILFNSVQAYFGRFDPYPFILLNLALSFQAAFAAPFIMISQNRQAEKDRLTAQNDYITDSKGEEEIRNIMEHLDHQDSLILQVVQSLQDQNKRLEAQHQQMLSYLSKIDPQLAQEAMKNITPDADK
ncbi:DUF1003 domain-containing protein [Ktedonobacter racemifer]|uniref:DUF1003 domain-containing protein n=1 Tax=Ktedonobacter racemifer DSM 44963 TaxID=485913 RepID=D6TJD7_KTERA|nr:DUF1003 domain-containing protein [Ktedonobacter racemifer]EFH89544.1 protein of unknown function DUF1003 [Ktedonobacter racemifer DSM 44963]